MSPFQEMYNLVETSEDNSHDSSGAFEEDFGTFRHEILAIVLRGSTRVLGISLFRKDRAMEYFWQTMPKCCSKDATANSKGIQQ